MENRIARRGTHLRNLYPARLPNASKTIASLGLSSQISSPVLQSFLVRTSRLGRIDVIAEMAVPTILRPRASLTDLAEESAIAKVLAFLKELAVPYSPSYGSQRRVE